MAAKVTFDSTTRTIIPVGPVGNSGLIELDVQIDIYSDGKEDWLADATLHKFRFPVSAIGGQTVVAGKLGSTFLLTDGWRINPDLNVTYQVPGSVDGSFPIYGTGGLNEEVKSDPPFKFDHRSLIPWQKVRIRKVGNPTDALQVTLMNDDGVTIYGQDAVAGEQVSSTFEDHFVAFESAQLIPLGTPLHYHLERTGARDESNYYEIAYTNDPADLGDTIVVSNGVEQTPQDVVMLGTLRIEVPYTLNLNGNLFTDTGDPISLPSPSTSVTQQVSTLVELSAQQEADVSLMRKILDNGLRTDPDTGKLTLYDDDGTTPIRQWDIYEDVGGTQPYRGQGSERRDAPVEL